MPVLPVLTPYLPALFFSVLSFSVSALSARVGVWATRPGAVPKNAHWTDRARAIYPARALIAPLSFLLPVFACWTTLFSRIGNASAIPVPVLGTLSAFTAAVGVLWAGRFRMPPLPGAQSGLRATIRSQCAICYLLIPNFFIFGVWLGLLIKVPGKHWPIQFFGLILVTVCVQWKWFYLKLAEHLGFLSPAPVAIRERIDEIAARSKIPPIAAYAVPIHMVNAFAWVRFNAIGFTEPALATLTVDELVAIAGHELGHLAEAAGARRMRGVASWFFPVALATSVLWTSGKMSAISWAGAVFIAAAVFSKFYRRFSRRMEAAADAFAESILPTGVLARALERIYETNCMPVVTGRHSSTHPDLYDRMIALHAQPAYPRPEAPSRELTRRGLQAAMVVALIGFGTAVAGLSAAPAALTGRIQQADRQPASR